MGFMAAEIDFAWPYHRMISMKLLLTIVGMGGELLPPGSPLTVEIRDTSLADAPATVLRQLRTDVPRVVPTTGVPVTMDLPAIPEGATIWVHVDTDRDGRVSKGDFVSVESYPVDLAPAQTLTIRVKKV